MVQVLQIKEHEIYKLGNENDSAWIRSNLDQLAMLPSWWILFSISCNIYSDPLKHALSKGVMLRGFAILLKIIRKPCEKLVMLNQSYINHVNQQYFI